MEFANYADEEKGTEEGEGGDKLKREKSHR